MSIGDKLKWVGLVVASSLAVSYVVVPYAVGRWLEAHPSAARPPTPPAPKPVVDYAGMASGYRERARRVLRVADNYRIHAKPGHICDECKGWPRPIGDLVEEKERAARMYRRMAKEFQRKSGKPWEEGNDSAL